MKKTLNILVLMALIATISVSGCKKDDDDDNDDPPVTTSELSAKIDGVQFNALAPISGMLDSEDNDLRIMGTSSTGILTLSFNGDITNGTYTVGSGTPQSISWDPDGGFTYWARPGTIVVTKHDTANRRIEGTFTATLESSMPPTISLTNGVFKFSYTVI